MARVAVLVDLGFFLPRYRSLIETDGDPPHELPAYQFRKALHHELVCLRKVALRLGELSDRRQWLLRGETTRRLLKREIEVQDLTEDDVTYDAIQKGVDIKFTPSLHEHIDGLRSVWPKPSYRALETTREAAVPSARAEVAELRSTLETAG